MENNGNQDLPPPTLCRTGCGFFSSPAFEGLCSQCYKEAVKRKQQQSSSPGGSGSSGRTSPSAAAAAAAAAASLIASDRKPSASQLLPPAMDTATPTVSLLRGAPGAATPADDSASAECNDSSSCSSCAGESPSTAVAGADGGAGKPEEKKTNRCTTCRKKVGLTGFQCRCGGLYCSVHRYSDKHACGFDYKEHGAELIRKHNPVIVGEKVQKL